MYMRWFGFDDKDSGSSMPDEAFLQMGVGLFPQTAANVRKQLVWLL
jgi:hypothetical protein